MQESNGAKTFDKHDNFPLFLSQRCQNCNQYDSSSHAVTSAFLQDAVYKNTNRRTPLGFDCVEKTDVKSDCFS